MVEVTQGEHLSVFKLSVFKLSVFKLSVFKLSVFKQPFPAISQRVLSARVPIRNMTRPTLFAVLKLYYLEHFGERLKVCGHLL